jgi:glycosyltransferase involved in cell wall biosynthesis
LGRSLRLLQLVHGYPPAVGGVEFMIRDLCERLVARHGVDVTVFTTNAYTNANFLKGSLPVIPIKENEEQNGVKVRRFTVDTRLARPLRVLQRVAYNLRLPGNDRLRTWYQGPRSPAMRRAVEEFDADVVCASSFPLNHMTYAFHCHGRPVVLIGAIHTNDVWGYARRHLIELVGRSYATIAFTEQERDWLVARGAPYDRVRVRGLGIDADVVEPRPSEFRSAHGISSSSFMVAYVGQQGSHKGIDTLIEAFPRLLVHNPDSWLVVAGAQTPYSEHLRRLQRGLPAAAAGRFRLLDYVSEQDKANLLAACDVFASPSGFESFGITTLEAWARCKPVVVGRDTAQRSIVQHGVTGLLVPYRRPDRLLDALLRLASDPEGGRRMGEAGRRVLLERYTWDRVADQYHELFQEAAHHRPPQPSTAWEDGTG